MGIDRWLEFGVISALLIVVVVYILRHHMPSIIKSFREGMANIAKSLRDVNKSLVDLKLLVTTTTGKAVKDCQQTCQHTRERNHDAMIVQIKDLEEEVRKTREKVNNLCVSVDRFLS